MTAIIQAENLSHSYVFSGHRHTALDGLSVSIHPGELTAVLGRNGSGKTTFIRHINVLLETQSGELTVASLDAKNRANVWKIREKTGMVFQNPENQFVSSIVEEDLAFGPRNFGVSEEEIPERVREALVMVGMSGFEKRAPQFLSGGQKQRIAIAGVLACAPDILIFDEVTAMLDPQGKADVLGVIGSLHDAGRTILMVTHAVEEAVSADRVLLMDAGKIIGDGAPREILTDTALLRQAGLEAPLPVRLYEDLTAQGVQMRFCPLTLEEFAEAL